jgi:hypothetical protein
MSVTSSRLNSTLPQAAQDSISLLALFWGAVVLLTVGQGPSVLQAPGPTALAFVLITGLSLAPLGLWCAGYARGIPIYPIAALVYLNTYALPLLSENPNVLAYSPWQQFQAGITTALFLGGGLLGWLNFAQPRGDRRRSYRCLRLAQTDTLFLVILGLGSLLNLYIYGGWTWIPAGVFTTVRGAVLGLVYLGVFLLTYRAGKGELTSGQQALLLGLLLVYLLTASLGFVLKQPFTLATLAAVSYVIGSRRPPPLLPLLLIGLLLLPLHYGKHPMRQKYSQGVTIQPWEIPKYYGEWLGYSGERLLPNEQIPAHLRPKEEGESIAERASLIHMLMLAQKKIPEPLPYLGGRTYALVPQLVVPRVLSPAKLRTHEGTHQLNVYVGRQTYTDTLRTTIAWGLLAEAYANFGNLGAALIGLGWGLFYGWLSRRADGCSSFSEPSLTAFLFLSFAIASSEWTAGVYAATAFQSMVPIWLIDQLLMKRVLPLPPVPR